jgi:hypothetical protein
MILHALIIAVTVLTTYIFNRVYESTDQQLNATANQTELCVVVFHHESPCGA